MTSENILTNQHLKLELETHDTRVKITNHRRMVHDINSKPIVAMKLSNEEAGNEIYFRALLDPGSFSNSTQEKKIVSYSYHILLVVSH